MNAVFDIPQFEPKPRQLRQTWLKDVGYDEAPFYVERMGLAELPDFLRVVSERVDYVKVTTPQVLYAPRDWLSEKISVYKRFGVEPYLDHSYFKFAYNNGVVKDAIILGSKIGFTCIEFMNTWDDVSLGQWREWINVATEHGMSIIYEHHPIKNWNKDAANIPSSANAIITGAIPFFEQGAFIMMLDHEELELQAGSGGKEIEKVIAEFGLTKLVFEVTSPKESPTQWRHDLNRYFEAYGHECNVANVMPSQALFVENIRRVASGGDGQQLMTVGTLAQVKGG